MFKKIKTLILKLNNKLSAKAFIKKPKLVSIQCLENPVKPKETKNLGRLNMGFNPRRRGNTGFTQINEKHRKWKYNPYFVSFLKAVMDMDAFPEQFLNGLKEITYDYKKLLNDLDKLGASDYKNAFIKSEQVLINNGIISVIKNKKVKTVYINEWDLFIAAIDAYAMFKI